MTEAEQRMTEAGERLTEAERSTGRATVWHVGGDDVHMRIPLLLALRARGFAVGAVGSESGEAFAEHAIPYHRYTLGRWLDPLQDWRSVNELAALFRAHRPDIVHAFDTKPIMLAPLAGRRAGVGARLRTVTGMGYVFSSRSPLALALRPVYRAMQQWADGASSLTVFQNDDDRAYYLRHGMAARDRSALVPGSGIDAAEVLGRVPDAAALTALGNELRLNGKTVVTMVARMVRTKGVVEFINAAERVRRRRDDVCFVLVGPQASEGRQAVPQTLLQNSDAACWLGARRDVPALLALSDVFVLPSYYREGVPRVLLEAATLGLPLITTDMPGCKDVVSDGDNGLLVAPRNAAAIASAVERLLDDASLRATMGRRSKERVERFALPRVADRYAALYRRALRPGTAAVAGEPVVTAQPSAD